jgi:sec-independent protein translocase protein TatC
VILLVAAALLTPPDPFTQLVMALPLIVLYEACVWLIWLKERRTGGTVPRVGDAG